MYRGNIKKAAGLEPPAKARKRKSTYALLLIFINIGRRVSMVAA